MRATHSIQADTVHGGISKHIQRVLIEMPKIAASTFCRLHVSSVQGGLRKAAHQKKV